MTVKEIGHVSGVSYQGVPFSFHTDANVVHFPYKMVHFCAGDYNASFNRVMGHFCIFLPISDHVIDPSAKMAHSIWEMGHFDIGMKIRLCDLTLSQPIRAISVTTWYFECKIFD